MPDLAAIASDMDGWSDVVVIIGFVAGLIWRADRKLRAGPLAEIRADLALHAKRDCVHHSMIFERLDISSEEVLERERVAGVAPKIFV